MVKKNLTLAFAGALLMSSATSYAQPAPVVAAVKCPNDEVSKLSITKAAVLTGLVYWYYAAGEKQLTSYIPGNSPEAVRKILEILLIKAAANELSDIAKVFYNKYVKGVVEIPSTFIGL